MDERLLAIAAAHHGLVSAATVRAAGVTRACLRWAAERRQLTPLARGVWCLTSLWDAEDARGRHVLKVRAAQLVRPNTAACAESAAVALGLPLPGDPPEDPRLLCARDAGRRGGDGRKGGARGRRAYLLPEEVATTRAGIRTTTPARTVVDLARHLTFPWALAIGDAARRFHRVRAADLVHAAARNPCAPGHPSAVLVARHAHPEPESALESLNRGVMIQLGLPTPEPQRWLRYYRVDLFVERYATVIEADGKVKYRVGPETTEQDASSRVWKDKRRRDELHDWGYETVRFVMADVHRPRQWGRRCVRSFERAYERRGLALPDWGPLTAWL